MSLRERLERQRREMLPGDRCHVEAGKPKTRCRGRLAPVGDERPPKRVRCPRCGFEADYRALRSAP